MAKNVLIEMPNAGDVVVLQTGGPDLSVVDSCPNCGDVEVVWFTDDGILNRETLPVEVLRSTEVN